MKCNGKRDIPKKQPKKQKNLLLRHGVWYLRIESHGRAILRSLKTPNKEVAESRARAMIAMIRGEHWKELDRVKSKGGVVSITDITAKFKEAARIRGLGAHSIVGYLSALRTILEKGGIESENVSSAVLTRELVEKYVAAVVLKPGNEQRHRRTARSTLRQARAIFSRWAMEQYRGMTLPDLSGFLQADSGRATPVSYRLPPKPLIDETLKAGRKLADDKPHLYVAFLLCYDLGLRAIEAVACRWDWFREVDGRRYLDIIKRANFSPKGRERSVPVSAEVWEHLGKYGAKGEWVMPGKMLTDRNDIVRRDFADWMRSIGWDPETYPKAAHELRKLIGSRWYTERGAEVAQTWLGHKDISTTCRYYATLTRQPEPLSMEAAPQQSAAVIGPAKRADSPIESVAGQVADAQHGHGLQKDGIGNSPGQ